jgi:hypothetical protein
MSLTRRRFLAGAGGVAAGGVTAGVLDACGSTAVTTVPEVPLGAQPSGLPARQFAWVPYLKLDSDGDPIVPKYDRLLFFDVNGTPGPSHARMLEASLRTLERAFPWGPDGLLFTAGWSPGYFEQLKVTSPIPHAKAMSDFEQITVDPYDLCLHFACDDENRLAAVEAALLHGEALPGADGHLKLADALTWRESRTGFAGAGLPAAHQQVGGIPKGDPVPKSSPLFMGFKSALKKNQATEDDVTIPSGPFAGGTTQQVSYMRLRLDSWYQGLTEKTRVALMYSPQTTPEQVDKFTTDAESNPGELNQAINKYGIVGHAQTSARARKGGRPVIIRRDFDTVDGGQAGVHFVSVQRSIEDFVNTRTAMNASSAQLQNPVITDTDNNGINAFIFVLKRANYVIPSRAQRSFPLLPGRASSV